MNNQISAQTDAKVTDKRSPKQFWITKEKLVSISTPLAILIIWEISAQLKWIDTRILPAPTVVVATTIEMLMRGTLVRDILDTLWRFVLGMVLGVIPGVLIGLTMGIFYWVGVALNPIVGVFYNVPRIALFPLVLIFLGLNESSNILMIALAPFFTMLITAMGAVRNIEQVYRDVAKNFNAGTYHLYSLVMLPAIAPALMSGLRIAMGLGLLGTVTVEFLVADSGVGRVIWNSWQVLSLRQSMAGLIVASIIGYAFYASLAFVEHWVIPWQSRKK